MSTFLVPGGGEAAWALPGAPPLYATPRDPSLPTDGGQVAVVGQALGTPLIPWQRHVADVAGERLADPAVSTGWRYRYRIIVVTVPRQSGKTTLMRAVGVTRGIRHPGHETFYTAQTGKDARERWRDLVRQVDQAPALRGRTEVRQAAGSERLILPRGSAFRCFAPTAQSLHGYTPPLVMLDESFAHDQAAGDDLMGAIVPAQSTLPHRQLWIVSTAGTAESAFLRAWVDAGRRGDQDVALFEWAAADGVNVYDPDTWPTFHPGLDFVMDADALASAAASLSRAEFERAYGNRWTLTSTHLIPADVWAALIPAAGQPKPNGDLVLTYDVAHDRASASILANWHDADGKHQARIVLAGPGYSWVAQSVADLAADLGARLTGADDGGAAREVTDALTRNGHSVQVLNARDYATACGALLGRIEHGTFGHDGAALFASAAAGVVVRPMGDGVAFSRRHSAGDISPMVGAAVGGWLLDRVPAPQGPPLIYVGQ